MASEKNKIDSLIKKAVDIANKSINPNEKTGKAATDKFLNSVKRFMEAAKYPCGFYSGQFKVIGDNHNFIYDLATNRDGSFTLKYSHYDI